MVGYGQRLALASGHRFELHDGQDRGVAGYAKRGEIFTFQMQADRLADVIGQLVEGGGLSDDRQVEALRHELTVSFADSHL